MTNTRKDYKSDRNKMIYDEYINTDTSYNTLAKKYDLTPQRIQIIVKDAKEKGIGETLSLKASKTKREKLKDAAIEQREKGNYELALDMFTQVLEWDQANKNYRGESDVHGHIALTHQKISKELKAEIDKLDQLNIAEKHLNTAIQLSKSKKVPIDSARITTVTLARNKIYKSQLLTKKKKDTELKNGIKLINSVLKNFPGSDAHKAWPLNVKCQLLNNLGKHDEAFSTGLEAEAYIYKGYAKEIGKGKGKDDQAEMRLRIWLIGIHTSMAIACKDTGKDIMAEYYANSAVKLKDETGTLKSAKDGAKVIMDTL